MIRERNGMLRAAGALIGLLVALWFPPTARAWLPGGDATFKLDPRVRALALASASDTLDLWITFADKGETGPADLARRLAEAEAALAPHACARRLRAGVAPLVDYLDLPVHGPYVDSLTAAGLAPFGSLRWFNRVAVRASLGRVVAAARLGFVSHVAPAERSRRMRVPPVEAPVGPHVPARETARSGLALDYGYSAQQLAQIGVPALHDSGYTGGGVRICVLDDGFNYHDVHPALKDAEVLCRRDFVRGQEDPTDPGSPVDFAHGTWTLSCIAGNEPGQYVGAAPGAAFALGRTEDNVGERQIEMVFWSMGAEWADSLGADIISSSLGYMEFDPPDADYAYADMDGHTTIVSRAAQIAASKGILIVNSAGNEGDGDWRYIVAPADVDGDSLIAVGAVDATGSPAAFSSYGPSADGRVKPDLAARGVGTCVARAAASGYAYQSGTSFSCPLVAGLAACLMQARPGWPPTVVVRALRLTASSAEAPDDRVGYGVPDGAEALRWVPDPLSVSDLPPLFLGMRLAGANPISATAPRTYVRFGAGAGLGDPRLRVLDVQGRCVARGLAYAPGRDAGDGLPMTASWDGRDDSGRLLPAGIYFIVLEAGGRCSAVRVVSLR